MRAQDREKFVKLATRRMQSALKTMQLIGNLSNRSNYSYTDKDASTIIKTLKAAVAECETKFAGREPESIAFRLE